MSTPAECRASRRGPIGFSLAAGTRCTLCTLNAKFGVRVRVRVRG